MSTTRDEYINRMMTVRNGFRAIGKVQVYTLFKKAYPSWEKSNPYSRFQNATSFKVQDFEILFKLEKLLDETKKELNNVEA